VQQAIAIIRRYLSEERCLIHKPEGAIFLWLWFKDLPITTELLTTHVLNGSDSLLYTVHLTVDLHAREYVMIVSTGLVAGLCG
ncbi:hypothetical protein MJH54_34540, partial [Salmonella enterica subsp. enterica serovar Montevideo]|nr:hypothetical protein [Salmonella enterica subsp. enterica serovar Montevideo]